jgi:hypothetical protein
MPRSFEAFNSSTAELKAGPNSTRARHKIVVVLPTPGGPCDKYNVTVQLLQYKATSIQSMKHEVIIFATHAAGHCPAFLPHFQWQA